jgi:tetratricopeptide (TPR) repeat protein
MRSFVIRAVVITSICSLAACAGLGIRTDSRAAFETGLMLFNQGKYNDAIPHFVKATELDAEFAQAYLYLGRSYLNMQRWFEALAPLRTAWRLSPGDTQKEMVPILLDALLGAAGARLSQGQFQESVSLFKEALRLAPDADQVKQPLLGALLAYGGHLLAQGNPSEAVSAYTEATQLAPQSVEGYLGLARAFFQTGEVLRALTAAGNALRLAPTNPDALSLFQQLQRR